MGGEREPKINYAHCSFDPKGERGEVFSTLVRLLHLIDLEELGGGKGSRKFFRQVQMC